MSFCRHIVALLLFFSLLQCQSLQEKATSLPGDVSDTKSAAVKIGRIASADLIECSGIDVSSIEEDLLWAINDSGDGPFVYAMGIDGRDLGRVRINGAINRDWEDLTTFRRQGRPMILVADIGDNRARHDTCRLYIIEEPRLTGNRFERSATTTPSWTIAFKYPDGSHDAEAIAVDLVNDRILILTKREKVPLLFSIPLAPPETDDPRTARLLAKIDQIPPPTSGDLLSPYGRYRSQPTAMDLSPDGLMLLILTYKHAYLLRRQAGQPWHELAAVDETIVPLPQKALGLVQREAACFSPDSKRADRHLRRPPCRHLQGASD